MGPMVGHAVRVVRKSLAGDVPFLLQSSHLLLHERTVQEGLPTGESTIFIDETSKSNITICQTSTAFI